MQLSCDLGRAPPNRPQAGPQQQKKSFFPLQRRNKTEANGGLQSETAATSQALMRGSAFQIPTNVPSNDKKEELNSTYGS